MNSTNTLALLKEKLLVLSKHGGLRRYSINSMWMIAEQVLRLLSGLFVGIWVARYLGPDQFGVLSYVLAFVALFNGFARLGLDKIAVRELLLHTEEQERYLCNAFWLKFFGALVSLTLVFSLLSILPDSNSHRFYILIIASGLIFQSMDTVSFYFQSKVLLKFVSICKFTQLCVSALIKIWLVLTQAELVYFFWVALFDQVFLAVTLYFAYKYHTKKFFVFNKFDFSLCKKLMADAWPFLFSALVITIYMRIDQVMIQYFMGSRNVGLYSAAIKISEIWYFIPALLSTALFPAIVSAKKISQTLYFQRLQYFFTFLFWTSFSAALVTTLLADWLIVVLYGDAFEKSSDVLVISIWASVFVFLGVGTSSYLTAENLGKVQFSRTVIGALINVILNLILIPIYGIEGAAMATLLAQASANYLFDFSSKDLRQPLIMKSKAVAMPFFFIKELFLKEKDLQ